jgi:tetratricopeptide (TPR) repeat protein
MQQEYYEQALPILQELHRENPGTFTFYDQLTKCLINLKNYDEAIEVSKAAIESGSNVTRKQLRLAEIYHLSGSTDEAMELWQRIIDENPRQIQVYHSVASSMSDRREYDRAIEVYQEAREVFENGSLFTNEIANAFMQSGQFEKAVNEYYAIITETPQQMGFVQQRFLRMRNDELYSIAALELEDYLLELNMEHPSYGQLYQLLSWLLLETQDYRRAFAFARRFESQTEQTNYSLYSLGNRLRSAREYEIAADAYSYYIDSGTGPVTRAMEEKATTFVLWARYLEQQGIGSFRQVERLYEEAYSLNESIAETSPNYNRIERVYTSLIDLSLDHFKDIEKADLWYDRLLSITGRESSAEPYTLYSEGRIALFNEDYTTARQALTRADRATENSNLSEKSRYYLSLSDFFAGDFEFAQVQLSSLERRNTSFFANNAIKLGMWIKNGLRMDSTGTELRTFSNALRMLHTGRYESAVTASDSLLNRPSHPFTDDLILEFAGELPAQFQPFVLTRLQQQVTTNQNSPKRERLMWERAEIADQLLTASSLTEDGSPDLSFFNPDSSSFEFLSDEQLLTYGGETILLNRDSVREMYEAIRLEFPEGFYAHYTREKLQNDEIQTL